MKDLDLPPFPSPGKRGPQVCASVRFYLAIIDDLSFEQVRVLSEHIKACEACSVEFRLLQQTTHALRSLAESAPSGHVDAAVLASLRDNHPGARTSIHSYASMRRQARHTSTAQGFTSGPRRARNLALVAALLLLLVASLFVRHLILPGGDGQAFQLPSHLTWNGYVLHYTQTSRDRQQKLYQVEVYQDLGTNSMHIESSMGGVFDVVVVTDHQKMLGKDMMHHVASEDSSVEDWSIDGSLFDLTLLRQRLASGYALYLHKGTFQGQPVYQIRVGTGTILLLNMQYLPVNALSTTSLAQVGETLYHPCILLPSEQVSASMWDMSIPPGFKMGQMPAKS